MSSINNGIAGASILGVGGRDPQILGRGSRVAGGSWRLWTGPEILLYLFIYRIYVQSGDL